MQRNTEIHDPGEVAVVHRQSSPDYDILGDGVYYPVEHGQVRDLLGRVLTHLDAMALTDRAHRASRTLLTQEVWRWWGGVYDNTTTSYLGCIAPIIAHGNPGSDEPPSNRWGWESEAAYMASVKPQNE